MTVSVPPCNLTAEIHDNPPFIFLNIAFSAINSIATYYETICEDSKKAVKFSPSPPLPLKTGVLKYVIFSFSWLEPLGLLLQL